MWYFSMIIANVIIITVFNYFTIILHTRMKINNNLFCLNLNNNCMKKISLKLLDRKEKHFFVVVSSKYKNLNWCIVISHLIKEFVFGCTVLIWFNLVSCTLFWATRVTMVLINIWHEWIKLQFNIKILFVFFRTTYVDKFSLVNWGFCH